MKVSEIANMGTELTHFSVIDLNTRAVLYDEAHDGGKGSKEYLECKDLEAFSIGVGSSEEITIYVDTPNKRYNTWLDVTYSIKIETVVPFGHDKDEVLRQVAETELSKLPNKMTVDNTEWKLTDNNMITGHFYEMIDEIQTDTL